MKNLFFVLLLSFSSVLAQAFTVPALTTPVVDQVGILSQNQKLEIENMLLSFRSQQQAQIQVLIVPDLQGDSIEGAAIQIFDQWKLGDAKRDDGLLMLFAINERKMRIEVGQGLEGSVPDVIAKRIIAEVIRPFFQRGEFYQGIKLGVLAVEGAITEDPTTLAQVQNDQIKDRPKKTGGRYNVFVFGFIFFIWLIIFMISPSTGINLLLFAFSRGGGGRSGYGGGSNHWSGGGGSSSGGGASGSW